MPRKLKKKKISASARHSVTKHEPRVEQAQPETPSTPIGTKFTYQLNMPQTSGQASATVIQESGLKGDIGQILVFTVLAIGMEIGLYYAVHASPAWFQNLPILGSLIG